MYPVTLIRDNCATNFNCFRNAKLQTKLSTNASLRTTVKRLLVYYQYVTAVSVRCINNNSKSLILLLINLL
jgi:hypothetical protein